MTGSPPRPPLALCLGITGHRALSPADAALLEQRLPLLLGQFETALAGLRSGAAGLFADEPTSLTLVSPLAEGADQIAAAAALAGGWHLDAVLPLPPADYGQDMEADDRQRLADLLARARTVWTLPDRQPGGRISTRGYELVGDATLAQSDLLIAAWDGKRARGPGGTAQVVENAIRRGIPVIHLPTRADGRPELLWGGFAAMDVSMWHPEDVPRRPLDDVAVTDVLKALLLPPDDEALAVFFAESEQRSHFRVEWPLLQVIAGTTPFRLSMLRSRPYHEAAAQDWAAYRGSAASIGGSGVIDPFQKAFAWADGLAVHYAQVYRSGMVFNFVGAALAVLLSLAAFLLPQKKLPLLEFELALIFALIANTTMGTRRQWHRRWLDYRFLAEQLRPLKSLKLAAAAAPPFRKRVAERRWTDWYALSLWRSTPMVSGLAGANTAQALGEHVAAHEIDDQVAYYAAVARRMHLLDHRLHQVGSVLLVLTIITGSVMLFGLLAGVPAIKAIVPVLAVLSAALPTIGAAVFGIRNAGDFAGVAGRSADTSIRLSAAAELLRRDGIDYATTARVIEEASAIMLADLSEWRSSYAYRKLAIPS